MARYYSIVKINQFSTLFFAWSLISNTMKKSIFKVTIFLLFSTIYYSAFSQGNLTFHGAATYTSTFGLAASINRVVVDTISISPGYILKLENDNFAGLSLNTNGNLTNINAPLSPNNYSGVTEIIKVSNRRYYGGITEKSYPLWLNSGTYHIIWHNENGNTIGGGTTIFFRYSLHGLLFSIN